MPVFHRTTPGCTAPITCTWCLSPAVFRHLDAYSDTGSPACAACFRADVANDGPLAGFRVGVLPCGTHGELCGKCRTEIAFRHPDIADCEVCGRWFFADVDQSDCDPCPAQRGLACPVCASERHALLTEPIELCDAHRLTFAA